MLREAQGGMMYVPRYAVAKYALSLVVNVHSALNAVKTPKICQEVNIGNRRS